MQNTEQNTSARSMLLLPLRGLAIFPGMVSHFDVGRQKSIKTRWSWPCPGGSRCFCWPSGI